jgi:hypothetical protein
MRIELAFKVDDAQSVLGNKCPKRVKLVFTEETIDI